MDNLRCFNDKKYKKVLDSDYDFETKEKLRDDCLTYVAIWVTRILSFNYSIKIITKNLMDISKNLNNFER